MARSSAFQAGSDGGELPEGREAVNIVVIGATGDLAKKYLWQGFFNLVLGKYVDQLTLKSALNQTNVAVGKTISNLQ